MIRPATIFLAATAGLFGLTATAQPISITLPFGDLPAELSGPDSELVVIHCSSCHSLDYITTQPRGKGEQFWRDTVAKMVRVYEAPL